VAALPDALKPEPFHDGTSQAGDEAPL
jgi:hypothetical protein